MTVAELSAKTGYHQTYCRGHDPRWSRDGKELFYRTNDRRVVAVAVIDLKHHSFGKVATLFRLPDGAEYDAVDGKSFLVNEPIGPATSRRL